MNSKLFENFNLEAPNFNENNLRLRLQLDGFNPDDRTEVRCDICCVKAEYEGKNVKTGGVILEDPHQKYLTDLFTFSCQECFDTFINIPAQKRVAKTKFQQNCINLNIGVNAVKYIQFNPKRSFALNVLLHRHIWGGQWKTIFRLKNNINDKKDNNIKNGGEADELAATFTQTCNACGDIKNEGQFKRCKQCKLARYCDKECQKKHWKTHKKLCNLIRDSFIDFAKEQK